MLGSRGSIFSSPPAAPPRCLESACVEEGLRCSHVKVTLGSRGSIFSSPPAVPPRCLKSAGVEEELRCSHIKVMLGSRGFIFFRALWPPCARASYLFADVWIPQSIPPADPTFFPVDPAGNEEQTSADIPTALTIFWSRWKHRANFSGNLHRVNYFLGPVGNTEQTSVGIYTALTVFSIP